MKILQVNTHSGSGGAALVAASLSEAYRAAGNESWLMAGPETRPGPGVFAAPRRPALSSLRGRLDACLGLEDFNFPGSDRLLDLPPGRPDVVQCHNLHGGYFDLRALPALCARTPVVLTLHDAWLLSGHCAHSLDCPRWETGCGSCPYPDLYPAVRRDMTAYNWRRKRRIYSQSRLFAAVPSAWLLERVRRSMLAPALAGAKLIPNGIDLSVFSPGDQRRARESLGLPLDADILLFAAQGGRLNPWKDHATLQAAAGLVAEARKDRKLLFLALGEEAPSELVGRAESRSLAAQPPEAMARFYRAADLYVHAARADTFPSVVIEALACGTPVVATSVGGIPEQVKGLDEHRPAEATGALVAPGDPPALAAAVARLLSDRALLAALGANAAADARRRFDLAAQAAAYLAWFKEILGG